MQNVALRKESVDRNIKIADLGPVLGASLSARRAWIEISDLKGNFITNEVALRKESVDRNLLRCCRDGVFERRSPQGERG